MRLAIILMILMASPSITYSQQSSQLSEPEKTIESFFKAYKEVGHHEAITNLLSSNKWISKEDADTVAMELEALIVQVDQYYGYEKMTEKHYGKSIIQYTYLVKYERQPIKFIFRFYKPNKTWNTQAFKYEVEFMDELDEASKAFRFKENYGD